MRVNSLIILLCLLLCTVSCAPWQIGAEKDVVKNGIEFETFKEEKDGSKLGILAGDTVIDGWPSASWPGAPRSAASNTAGGPSSASTKPGM